MSAVVGLLWLEATVLQGMETLAISYTVAGSMTSAYLLTILGSRIPLWCALACLYVVATIGRLAAALLHLGPR